MRLSDKTYDVMKLLAIFILPLAALVTSLSDIWGIPYGQQVSQTLLALNVFLGAIIKTSSDSYWGGQYDELECNDTDDNQ